jgi:hypothetical protein
VKTPVTNEAPPLQFLRKHTLFGGPLADRGMGLRTCQHRACGQCEDEREAVTAALDPAWVGHCIEAGQQVCVFVMLDGPGVCELAQA